MAQLHYHEGIGPHVLVACTAALLSCRLETKQGTCIIVQRPWTWPSSPPPPSGKSVPPPTQVEPSPSVNHAFIGVNKELRNCAHMRPHAAGAGSHRAQAGRSRAGGLAQGHGMRAGTCPIVPAMRPSFAWPRRDSQHHAQARTEVHSRRH